MQPPRPAARAAPLTRSEIMARIRSRDTQPELAVRRAMHAAGLRYRLHSKRLPGRPDLAFPARRAVLFVHGCFWHRHPGCRHATTPATRRDYWLPKLARNVERDRSNAADLLAAGWTVLTVWECETRQPGVLSQLVGQVRAIAPGKRLRLPSAIRSRGGKSRQRPRATPGAAPVHDTSGNSAADASHPGPALF